MSFRRVFSDFTPETFPLDLGRDDLVIAPFWDDVDFRIAGQVLYRQTNSPDLLNQVGTNISNVFNTSFSPVLLFIATWNEVAASSGTADTVCTMLSWDLIAENKHHIYRSP